MTSFGLRRPRQAEAPAVDPAGGDPVLAELHALAEVGAAAAVVSRLRGFSGYDLSALVSGVTELPGLDGALPGLVQQSPGDPLPRLLLGSRTIHRAWAVRTAARARHVSQEQFAQFHALLSEAEEHLYDAARLDPGSAAPWSFLLTVGRGLEVGPEVSLRRFEAVIAREPAHLGAHRQRLQQLCRKWGGSHEQMHAFAREAMLGSSSPELGLLVAEAHIEQWLDLGGDAPGREYLHNPYVRQSLIDAASRSIGRPDYAPARNPYLGFNTFAFAFSLAGLFPAASHAFAATRGVVTKAPWQFLGQPLDAYVRWRDTSRKAR